MRTLRASAVATLLILAAPARAHADVTAFIGANTTPESRLTSGFAVGAGLLIIGFEFEYANAREDDQVGAPSVRTGMGNVLLQAPFEIFGIEPYATVGAGLYRERLGALSQTGFGFNSGAGVKISLLGPLRVRVDYRAFRLGSDALYSPAHRFYAGLNLEF